MAAILGVFGHVTQSELAEMGSRLSHRGREFHFAQPDAERYVGAWADYPEGAISSFDGVLIVCQATIYNKDRLVARVLESGVHLKSHQDAELILALYRSFGLAGIEAIDGDFAFAIVDESNNHIVFGRDFFGCAPLYFAALPDGGVAFASEYKAILAISSIEPHANLSMLQHLQAAKKLPLGFTLLQEVRAVHPGGLTKVGLDGEIQSRQTFAPIQVTVTEESEAEAVELVRDQLLSAVRRRSSDVDRIGLALSGGIDSIGLAFVFRRLYPEKEIHTFCAGSGPNDPEVSTARRVSEQIGSIHHEVFTPPSLLEERLESLVWHLEDPCSRSEALQLLELGRVAADYVRVLFSGQGADGLFGGMPRFRLLWLMKTFPLFRESFAEFYNLTQLGIRPRTLLGKCMEWARYRGRFPDVPKILGNEKLPAAITFPKMSCSFINESSVAGIQSGMCQDIQKFERGFAAWGIEYRSPFHDLQLARSSYRIGESLKISSRDQKIILRKVLASIVPDEFLKLPKFPQRMEYNVEFADCLDRAAHATLEKTNVESRGFFSAEELSQLQKRPSNERYSDEQGMRIWTALLTELWARVFLDCRGAPPMARIYEVAN